MTTIAWTQGYKERDKYEVTRDDFGVVSCLIQHGDGVNVRWVRLYGEQLRDINEAWAKVSACDAPAST